MGICSSRCSLFDISSCFKWLDIDTYRFSVHISQTPEKNSPGTQGTTFVVLVVVVFIHRFVSAHLLLQDSINLEGIAQLDTAGSFV